MGWVPWSLLVELYLRHVLAVYAMFKRMRRLRTARRRHAPSKNKMTVPLNHSNHAGR